MWCRFGERAEVVMYRLRKKGARETERETESGAATRGRIDEHNDEEKRRRPEAIDSKPHLAKEEEKTKTLKKPTSRQKKPHLLMTSPTRLAMARRLPSYSSNNNNNSYYCRPTFKLCATCLRP